MTMTICMFQKQEEIWEWKAESDQVMPGMQGYAHRLSQFVASLGLTPLIISLFYHFSSAYWSSSCVTWPRRLQLSRSPTDLGVSLDICNTVHASLIYVTLTTDTSYFLIIPPVISFVYCPIVLTSFLFVLEYYIYSRFLTEYPSGQITLTSPNHQSQYQL